jgi:c(7)-type cytochrome triheme protein
MKSTKAFRIALIAMLAFVILHWNSHAAAPDGGFVAYPSLSESPGPVVFSHRSHGISGAGYECSKCHEPASAKTMTIAMDGIRQGRACGSCHDGRTKGPRDRLAAASIQDCSACHMPAADIIITMNRMDPVAFSHVRHLAVETKKATRSGGFSCSDCHPKLFERVSNGPIGMEVPHESHSGGCANCHNGQERRDGLPPAFAANARCLSCHKP